MSRGRVELLQWFGLLAAPLAWAVHLAVGYYLELAHCDLRHPISGWTQAQIALTATAALVALLAELAAARVYLELRRVEGDAPGPRGRQHFFAIGGMVGNVLFLVAILLTGVTLVTTAACRQS
jgi:hypothetical protein